MSIAFDHCIVFAADAHASASFLVRLFGLPEPVAWGPFVSVLLDGGVVFQYAAPGIAVQAQHDAFRVSEDEFDAISGRIVKSGLEHWADPRGEHPGTFNRTNGGRRVYVRDPAGHGLEILTRPDGAAG